MLLNFTIGSIQLLENEACGRPLVADFFSTNDYELCTLRKSCCAKHYKWEKLCAAEIDLIRLRQYMKIEELNERRDQLSQCMARRNSLLGMMLHQTHTHSNYLCKDSIDVD
ncbi:hypothetical protein GJ496_008816 [Pomphorhynchus laevis]|nr:hypothetical protein GJ496_008816 [Pomphorhynchus laevis]